MIEHVLDESGKVIAYCEWALVDKDGIIDFYQADLSYYETYKKLSDKHNCKPRKPGLSEIVSENIIKLCLNKNNISCTLSSYS